MLFRSRSQDGRGPRTELETAVPEHFGLETPLRVAEAIHLGELPRWRVAELAPIVLAAARGDVAAAGIADRLVAEAADLVRVALDRLGATNEPIDIVLGGGLFRDERLTARIAQELGQLARQANLVVVDAPPSTASTTQVTRAAPRARSSSAIDQQAGAQAARGSPARGRPRRDRKSVV